MAGEDLEVFWDEERGVVASMRGRLGPGPPLDPADQVVEYLGELGILFGPPDLPRGLLLLHRDEDDLDWAHLVYAYLLDGEFELYGSRLVAHVDASRGLRAVESSLWRDLPVDMNARVAVDDVAGILRARIESLEGFDELRDVLGDEPHFPATDTPRLVITPVADGMRLAWMAFGYNDPDEGDAGEGTYRAIEYGRIFVDAITGERILFAPSLSHAGHDRPRSGLAGSPLS